MPRPMTIDTSGWGAFDPNSAVDAMCERERRAFTLYVAKRLQKAAKTGSDEAAILTGGVMAIVQLVFSANEPAVLDAARESLHQTLDHAWLQVMSMQASDEATH